MLFLSHVNLFLAESSIWNDRAKGGLIRLNFKLGTQGKNIPCYIITQGFWLKFMNMSRVQRGKKWVALNSKYMLPC